MTETRDESAASPSAVEDSSAAPFFRDAGIAQPVSHCRISRILVPLDFSPASGNALNRAVALARECDATVTLLHVIDQNAQCASGPASEFMAALWQDSSEQMARTAWSLAGRFKAHTMIAEGLPWSVIVEQSRDFDLIVLGHTRNERSCWRPFARHTVRRVIDSAACPVLMVGERD